jgi:hypothetical protein
MNINIGNNRWIKFVRAPDGHWTGRGHGYRFRVERARQSFIGNGRLHSGTEQWRCLVYTVPGTTVITGCMALKMKSAILEGTRRADEKVAQSPTTPEGDVCPT